MELSSKALKRIQELKDYYPSSKSAVMPILQLIQEEFAEISEEAILWTAEQLEMPAVQVRELVTFYSMYTMKKRGKYHFQVCRTLSCAVMGDGCGSLQQIIESHCGVTAGEVSDDKLWSYEMVECLGSCGSGPTIQINDTYFESLSSEKLIELIERLRVEQPDLSFSTVSDDIGEGLSGCSPSAFCPERTLKKTGDAK